MLKIENLKVNIKKNNILQSINIKIKTGELHVIMGPNGSGKSSLVSTLVGKENYTIKNGKLFFNGINISELNIEERSKVGMLLSFQNPISIAGVKNIYFLHTALNEKLTYLQNETITVLQVIKKIKQKMKYLKIEKKLLNRDVNEAFSGGERKKNELLQMLLLKPKVALLDEIDSGLDIDSMKVVSNGINLIKSKKCSIVLITHYKRILNYIEPNFIHILVDGKIIKSGDKTLVNEIDLFGYKNYV
ncbi:Fe-S cluster assembly ATPase SufC [Candidatus Portiera aleyrodidarum]|uniref:Cysteine desulfurase n=1 Tax=Candidatus Portiera aleyrodidarum MED (Bemisia tabaci) TaxID=1163752 RepID=A0AAU8RQN8_9GAMM|nr:Fe-S cluster assembly ATPase SufC [Candidatus Portiera aleyrodidarum]AFQ24024.1 FeS assembly ATPase SufC [Candidatus Portiera aleyrodidarum BT-B-HRs]AFS18788.1 Putative ATP-dependent transporter SufC [Candidatus Portiera aleyrodidarum BT-QVLC]AFT80414.1 Iron-sulfur cluster assembly ATPase protein SufC [Candidatus Portiera aleyrodidarum BT-QVLC]AFT80695.1 Iron-sulfur cluster assembly ATPase protein SufC [Candidatus Portiera aleyrodidarum BT-B-HRs]AJF24001.1 cysteine desulfurase [Candidatus P